MPNPAFAYSSEAYVIWWLEHSDPDDAYTIVTHFEIGMRRVGDFGHLRQYENLFALCDGLLHLYGPTLGAEAFRRATQARVR